MSAIIRVNLVGGTLKLKTFRQLRRCEMNHKVPVMRLGSVYAVWWSNKDKLEDHHFLHHPQ